MSPRLTRGSSSVASPQATATARLTYSSGRLDDDFIDRGDVRAGSKIGGTREDYFAESRLCG